MFIELEQRDKKEREIPRDWVGERERNRREERTRERKKRKE